MRSSTECLIRTSAKPATASQADNLCKHKKKFCLTYSSAL